MLVNVNPPAIFVGEVRVESVVPEPAWPNLLEPQQYPSPLVAIPHTVRSFTCIPTPGCSAVTITSPIPVPVDAVIVAEPADFAVTRPDESTSITLGADEDQVRTVPVPTSAATGFDSS
jgi:hypothetical protein